MRPSYAPLSRTGLHGSLPLLSAIALNFCDGHIYSGRIAWGMGTCHNAVVARASTGGGHSLVFNAIGIVTDWWRRLDDSK